MSRLISTALLILIAAAPAVPAQNAIRWNANFEQGIAEAKRTHRPMMIYIHGYTDERRAEDSDIENDQRKAFMDPTVLSISKYFVPVQGGLAGHRDLLKKWGMSDKTEYEIVFVTPDGEKIDSIGSSGVAQPVSLAQKMGMCFTKYRNDYFHSTLQKVLDNEKSKPEEIRGALQTIVDFNILIADEALVIMLKRPNLPDAVRTQALDVIAKLSTPMVAKYLLEQASKEPKDPKALATLAKCAPPVAEQLIDWMEQGDDAKKQYLAYTTAAKIVKAGEVKNEAWWGKVNDKIKGDEIKRLSAIIRSTAQKWKERNGEFR